MVYKKYIKKDGRLYGPYIYESKRVDGKVVSEYHGSKRNVNLKKFIWIFASVVFIAILVYILSIIDFSGLTGLAILNTNVNYTEEQPIQGNVNILLKQGELLPANSKLILENSGKSYEYDLNEIVSNKPVSGDFYIKGISLSGSGKGYGIEGEKRIYSDVSFILEIYPSSEENQTTNQTENISQLENIENNASGGSENETISNEESEVSNESTETSNISEPVSNEDNEEAVVSEPSYIETTQNEAASTESEQTPIEQTSSEQTSTEQSSSESNADAEAESSSITGFFIRIYNFFLTLTPTGKAISESNEINGHASFGNPFVYDLSGGEGVQLKHGSVSVSGLPVSDNDVRINVNENKVIVETSYSEMEKGFGAEYSGNDSEILNINLSALELVLNKGDLTARIVYGNNEIISSKTLIMPGETKSVSENVTNSTILNVTIEQQNESILNSTQILQGLQVITSETAGLILTQDEKILLAQEFGADAKVETTKSEIFNGRLIRRYEIGNQWIEYSYDSNLTQENLEYQISLDRMKWLKDLAYRLKNKKSMPQQNVIQLENFSINE